jgi:hypothetical protein
MDSRVLLLSGKQGAGKTAVADALEALTNDRRYFFQRFKYAEPMYEMHNEVKKIAKKYGLEVEAKEGMLLQDLGYWGVKRYGTDIWAKLAAEKIVPQLVQHFSTISPNDNMLIVNDDCRRPEEFDAFPEAFRVRLVAPREIRKLRATSWREDENHPSETALDEYESLGKFNLILNTHGPTVEETSLEILSALKGATGWAL